MWKRGRRAGRVTDAAGRHSGSEEEAEAGGTVRDGAHTLPEGEAQSASAQSSEERDARARGERESGVSVKGGVEAKKEREERERGGCGGENTALSCSAALCCRAGSLIEQRGAGARLLLAVAGVNVIELGAGSAYRR